ncbi:unnamed protein product, partial [Ixodes hexagonus]
LRFFYNQYTEDCEVFTYSGCGGNENNFKTMHECKKRCIYTPYGLCALPPVKGPCSMSFIRYHWDKQLGDCKPFVYSGCAGNGNNFPDEDSCRNFCDDTKVGETTPYEPDAPRLPKECMEEEEPGDCERDEDKKGEVRYFYDHRTNSCNLFIFAGCNGNGNNFKDEDECQTRCRSEYTPDGACNRKPEKGSCSMKFPRFYWDKELGDCRPFEYSGCGGNANNFADMEECRRYC